MHDLAVMPRLLGALFYYPPQSEAASAARDTFTCWGDIYPWPDPSAVQALCAGLEMPSEHAFSVLFEGQGEMAAPPWGSVYLDKDNLLMGESAVSYRRFLQAHNLSLVSAVNEPEDQFGLMLLAMAALLEQGKPEAVKTLLEMHLLPWCYRYLELLKANGVSAFYARLAQLAEMFLRDLQTRAALAPANHRLWL